MIKLHLVCAARPNFMKVAPLYHALKNEDWCKAEIVHTGQHYDYVMSQAFFEDLQLPPPEHYLDVKSASHAKQTAKTMIAYEKLCLESPPDLVIVVGDVNSTLACAVAAKKLHLKIAHLEAGLRNYDRSMPEEINRLVTDSIADYHWTPSEDADQNLLTEGIESKKIMRVGNIMIDSYCMLKQKIENTTLYKHWNLESKNYIIVTLHRPSNVDNADNLLSILSILEKLNIKTLFPVHPRTKNSLKSIQFKSQYIEFIEPLSYIDFMSVVRNAKYVITDSGGLQEESTYLKIPCFTLRNDTERPITVTMGSNQLVNLDNLIEKVTTPKIGIIPPLWDGKTSERIIQTLRNIFHVTSNGH